METNLAFLVRMVTSCVVSRDETAINDVEQRTPCGVPPSEHRGMTLLRTKSGVRATFEHRQGRPVANNG